MPTLKAYDGKNHLWKSKNVSVPDCIQLALELNHVSGINKAWIKDGNQSKQLKIFPSNLKTVGAIYKGSDGIITYTIPIRASAYPYKIIGLWH